MKDSAIAKTVGNLVAKHLSNQKPGEADESIADLDLDVRSFGTIEAKPVAWLWSGRLALGKITLLTGEGGVGKSMLTCDLASRISRGDTLPDGGIAPKGEVFFIGAEDGAEDTVRPRLDAAGADVQVARIELRVVEDPEDQERRLLLPVKNNLAAAPGLAYRIRSSDNGAGFAEWEEGTVDISIAEVEADGVGDDRSAMEEAINWLNSFLSEGPVKASEAKREANKDGITEATLKRAKKRLRVESYQRDRSHWWRLPEGEDKVEEATDDHSSEEDKEEDKGNETSFVF